MRSRLPKAAVVIAVACSIGLHWALLQSLAWAGMVVSYAQEATLKEALAKTFDGRHPCSLCKAIAKSKQTEKKSEVPLQFNKLEFLNATACFVFSAPRDFWRLTRATELLKSVYSRPPTPPPRGIFV